MVTLTDSAVLTPALASLFSLCCVKKKASVSLTRRSSYAQQEGVFPPCVTVSNARILKLTLTNVPSIVRRLWCSHKRATGFCSVKALLASPGRHRPLLFCPRADSRVIVSRCSCFMRELPPRNLPPPSLVTPSSPQTRNAMCRRSCGGGRQRRVWRRCGLRR